MMKTLLVITLISVLNGAFEYRENTPSLLFPYRYASDDIESGNRTLPSYLPFYNYSYLSGAYSRPYSLGDLESHTLRCGQGFDHIAYQASWSRFGIREYREETFETNFGFRPVRWISAGFGVINYRMNIDMPESVNRYSLYDYHASCTIIPFEWLGLSVLQENISSLFHEDNRDMLHPNSSAGISLRPVPGLTFSWNINRTYYDYINSIALSANLMKCLNLKLGYSHETTTYAFSTGLAFNNITVSYGMRYHSYLGMTHCFEVTLTTGNPGYHELNYSARNFRSYFPTLMKKEDINTCTADHLKSLDFLSPVQIEGIIRYRKYIGPVTAKGLLQAGLKPNEIELLKQHVRGITDDRDEEENRKKYVKQPTRKRNSRISSMKRQKKIFTKLLTAGVKAGTALKLSSLAIGDDRQALLSEINAIDSINDEKRRKILSICSGY